MGSKAASFQPLLIVFGFFSSQSLLTSMHHLFPFSRATSSCAQVLMLYSSLQALMSVSVMGPLLWSFKLLFPGFFSPSFHRIICTFNLYLLYLRWDSALPLFPSFYWPSLPHFLCITQANLRCLFSLSKSLNTCVWAETPACDTVPLFPSTLNSSTHNLVSSFTLNPCSSTCPLSADPLIVHV